ncbi:MFS transporter [Paraburkholderia caballeronis]|uniref:D-galactonate transporter n=1 Tax=Paraburkholderia caballeronis TaxID=416943 RepID=A0A1H7FHN3_9BURK|nr:MFS transporter [Paraburkholderia caballeronis]PXW24973.1 D-galactonate transporter [Paraburkholderia caballeronis]PXX00703.1 D-galactonate transporter [Paraburkholderia caballeronis]RAJ98766.1 D-galactonate transporter [Paraburkholderia caballeronis]TDV35590.1 D-galactonate transporter [Paraburkholderia caballeronis]SEE72135.1 D-galactonate transporter [Paraburkholderia caballeronis]
MKQRTMGWVTVFLLFLVYGINYLDRVALSLTAPLIQQDLGIDTAQMGIVFSSFFVGYALFNFLGGLASDRLGPKLVYILAVGLWSIFCGLTAVAVGFASLLVLRTLFGMAEGPLCAGANKMVNNWLPRDIAATAMGLLSAGSPLGGAIAGPIIGLLAISFGWRPAFWIICAVGLVWALIWFFVTSDAPARNRYVTSLDDTAPAAAGQHAAPAADPQAANLPLSAYLRQPLIIAAAVAFFSYNYVLFFFLSWFPSYLVQAHHLNIKEMSFATVVPWLVGTIGLAAGGAISDAIFRWTGKLMLSRKIVLVTCLVATGICVAVAGSVHTAVNAIALMSVALFLLYVTGALYWAIVQDVVHPAKVGSVSGCMHCVGSLSGVVGPAITGFLVARTGSFATAFVLAGAVALVGAALSAVFIRDARPTARVRGNAFS